MAQFITEMEILFKKNQDTVYILDKNTLERDDLIKRFQLAESCYPCYPILKLKRAVPL